MLYGPPLPEVLCKTYQIKFLRVALALPSKRESKPVPSLSQDNEQRTRDNAIALGNSSIPVFTTPSYENQVKAYGLPKVHQPRVPLRPIVSLHGTPNFGLSKWLYQRLCFITKHSEWTVDSGKEFLTRIKQLKVKAHEVMVSSNVISLFTSFPSNLAIETIDGLLLEKYDKTDKKLKRVHTIKLPELCLKTFYTFHGKVYKQKKGTRMGSPPSGLIAEAVLHGLERLVFNSSPPEFWVENFDANFVIIMKTNSEVKRRETDKELNHDVESNSGGQEHSSVEVEYVSQYADLRQPKSEHRPHELTSDQYHGQSTSIRYYGWGVTILVSGLILVVFAMFLAACSMGLNPQKDCPDTASISSWITMGGSDCWEFLETFLWGSCIVSVLGGIAMVVVGSFLIVRNPLPSNMTWWGANGAWNSWWNEPSSEQWYYGWGVMILVNGILFLVGAVILGAVALWYKPAPKPPKPATLPGPNEPGSNECGSIERGLHEPGSNAPGPTLSTPGAPPPFEVTGSNEPGSNVPGPTLSTAGPPPPYEVPGSNEHGSNEPVLNERGSNEPGSNELGSNIPGSNELHATPSTVNPPPPYVE
ncbi:unnamed protein product [Dibothriocephalus latus]|uniref:Uncharacterized protein n=1 Tax=Dibothriocephalus latus TaxID=60516 RepID=A0A3P6SJC5_DIBLA|nr:unnamed protein product [Dibothriocephalus latus]